MICVVPGGAISQVRITEFCPDPYLHDDADEYIVLSGNGPLDGITVSDGKSGFRFPPGSTLMGECTVARNGTAFIQSHGQPPDYEWQDTSPSIPDVISTKTLRMANTNDVLMLYENGQLVQQVAWPADVRPREGQVHFLEGDVWDPRPLMLGQSHFSPAEFHDVTVTAFVSPDCSDEVFGMAIGNASKEILLNVYEFSNPSMADALTGARARGVGVQVLVEGGPVGGIGQEEKTALWQVNRSGIPVYAMVSTKTIPAPYRYNHAKYVVIDRQNVLIASENFKYSGFAAEGTTGNRGWGVILGDPATAAYFASVFQTDMSGPSVVPYPGEPGKNETPSTEQHTVEFTPRTFEGATVRPVLAPDTSTQITDLINSAEQTIDIEEAYITNETRFTLNPYLSAAINASRRGVHVRVLLDSYWFNVDGKNDNDEMVALINHIAAAEHLPLEARCAELRTNQIEKIHNKGVIVDGKRVLVSSINWNSNSPNFNREAGVIIDHPGVAGYFSAVFEDDWNPSVTSPVTETDYLKIAVALLVVAALLVYWYYRRRR
ncbi:phospholipase D-like domain-containing protein [Methanoregula sp.]|uniref:phospholipase D-like domain-containing protein n=1 Tax=Methanoregula sp. TaxID=2052170 RepID=UPI00236BE52D|nr:phospholipase D-like domain-containing protein [Methanoregula sp.]MDD1687757.1 phospholipase D-like domain-containing protein [Methanoregula sp.]